MTELTKVFQTAKDAYDTAADYYNEICDTVDGLIDAKKELRTIMIFSDNDEEYRPMMEQCKESIVLLKRVAEVFGPIVDELEQACRKLVENQELLRRGEQ